MLKKYYKFINFSVFGLLLLIVVAPAAMVFAAGGGGGGGGGGSSSPPACTEDTYSCATWSQCDISGRQTRTCALTFNCPTVETPKPQESQSCTPQCTADTWTCSSWSQCSTGGQETRSCAKTFDCPLIETPRLSEAQTCQPACTADTWSCGEWGACDRGRQTRSCALSFDCATVETPRPSESQSCTPVCSADEYQCGEWSQCQEDGHQRRSCKKIRSCPAHPSPKPPQQQVCSGLLCGQLPTLDERVACRLKLTQQELAAEFKILYFPEYCRAEKTTEDKRSCIAFYQALGPCWQKTGSRERAQCAASVIGLKPLTEEKSQCLAKQGKQRQDCVAGLREKIEKLVLFHLYELEVKAEKILDTHRNLQKDTEALEIFIEKKKQELERAKSVSDWKKIISEVKAQWQAFIRKLT